MMRSQEAGGEGKDDRMEFGGVVLEALRGSMFKVKCDNGMEVLATISGRVRKNFIRILPGDKVKVEVSAYDPTKGRITYRSK